MDSVFMDSLLGPFTKDNYSSYLFYTNFVVKRRCVKMHTFCFLRTKPRLSQAGALLLPKDFVSLGIRISL